VGERPSESLAFVWVVLLGAGAYWLWEHFHTASHTMKGPHVTAGGVHVSTVGIGAAGIIAAFVVLGLLLVAGAGALGWRLTLRRRRARSVRVEEIVLGPNDTAEPYEIMSALDAIHGQMLTRYVRSGMGQDFWTFEIVRTRDGVIHFLVAAPESQQTWLTAIEDTLRAKYTNIRFQPWTDEFVRWPVAQQIVLRKHWRHATETVKDYQNSVVETIVQALDRADGAAHLQFHLTPLPSEALHAKLRNEIRGMERSAKAVQQVDPAAPGVGYAESQAVKDSLQLYGKKAYRVEVRLGGEDWLTMQRVYGALQEADGENSFQATTVVAMRGLWIRWLYDRMPSLVAFRSSIMFSFPLATIIHLPSNRLRVAGLVRYYVRRAPAPRTLLRETRRERAVLIDHETGDLLAIHERDREAGVFMGGAQGSGKTTDELSLFRSDVHYRDENGRPKAVVLIDIGKDTSKRALGMVSPDSDRPVFYFAPGQPDCPWTVNPLRGSITRDVMQENVLNAMQEVFGEQAIQFRSREFLGNAIMAVYEVLGDEADFTKVYQLLTDEGFRNRVIQQVRDPHLQDYWQRTFVQAMRENPRFLQEGLAAPRNKLDELLRNRLVRDSLGAGADRTLLDFREVIRRRGVVIVNLDKARLGDAGVRLMGIFVVTLLWYAMQAQNDVEERDRVKVSLILDEAQNYLSEGFLNMLAEGRAYGLQVALAIRFLGEIDSPKVIAGLRQLIQNVIIHQFQLVEEARDFVERFMRTWASMVQVNAESQDAINFGSDDILRLPKFTTICQWMVNGAMQPAFLARTINWEEFYHDDWRLVHIEAQRALAADHGEGGSAVEEDEVVEVVGDDDALVLDEADGFAIEVTEASSDASAGGAAPTGAPARGAPNLLQVILGEDVVDPLVRQAQDELTGLLLRRVWERAVAMAPPAGNAVAYIDLNDLTGVNNAGGHAAGDRLIRRAGEAIRAVTRDGDVAARLGGDEFGILAFFMAPEGVEGWKARICDALDKALVLASVGVAVQQPGEDLQETIKRADAEMYRIKPKKKVRPGETPAAASPAGASTDSAPGAMGDQRRAAGDKGRSAAPAAQPGEWRDTDPRKRFCLQYGVPQARLVQAVAREGVSDEDVRGACTWALDKGIAAQGALARMIRTSGMKRCDRLLKPLARRMHVGPNGLVAELDKAGISRVAAADVMEEHPEVSSLEELRRYLPEPARAAR